MNAYVTKEELTLLQTQRMSYAQHAADAAGGKRRGAGLWTRFRRMLERQRVLAELNTLTDRELADIGLHRGDLAAVFSPAISARRG